MPSFPDLDPANDADSASSAYMILFLLTGLAVTALILARLAESQNRLKYDSRAARIIAGALMVIIRMLHTNKEDLELPNTGKKLLALGPHRTGWEAAVVAAKMKGDPPRFLATDAFDSIPGVKAFMKMFYTIPVAANPTKSGPGRTSNAGAIEQANKVLSENGCVALFPQGNFAKIGQEPPRIYEGVAKLAIANKMPIHVIRLDGFTSLKNPLIPLFVRNTHVYRAFLSALHVNNVRANLCAVISYHLENEHLEEKDKITEICAQLYAFYRHTQELTPKQIDKIKTEISDKQHLLLWKNRVARDELEKRLITLKKESVELEKPTLLSMSQI